MTRPAKCTSKYHTVWSVLILVLPANTFVRVLHLPWRSIDCTGVLQCLSKCSICDKGRCNAKCTTSQTCDETTGWCLGQLQDRWVYANTLFVYSEACTSATRLGQLAPCAKFSYIGGGAQQGRCGDHADGYVYILVQFKGQRSYLRFKESDDAIHVSDPCGALATTGEKPSTVVCAEHGPHDAIHISNHLGQLGVFNTSLKPHYPGHNVMCLHMKPACIGNCMQANLSLICRATCTRLSLRC